MLQNDQTYFKILKYFLRMFGHFLTLHMKRLNRAGHYIDAENKKDYFTEWVLKVNKTPRSCIIVILQGVLFNTLSFMIKIFTKIVFVSSVRLQTPKQKVLRITDLHLQNISIIRFLKCLLFWLFAKNPRKREVIFNRWTHTPFLDFFQESTQLSLFSVSLCKSRAV